ncbi:hypothetical protein [Streptomyces sp. NBC_01477]|uniref:hypothetical protein n=1 Tax=Streptomyces sp. NBC_01477 TaxID=2976015 RepID=UPI002E337734|nr:hypothetical protein [Streptomyces sp. NBC_01477]
MIHIVLALVAALAGAAAVVTFWGAVKDAVGAWLRERGLAKSALMSAVVVLDKLAVGVRRRVRLRTAQGLCVILDQELGIEDIDDPRIRAMAEKQQHTEIDILNDL